MRTIQVEDKICFLSVFYLLTAWCQGQAAPCISGPLFGGKHTLAQVSSSPLTGHKEACETGNQGSCFLPFIQHAVIQWNYKSAVALEVTIQIRDLAKKGGDEGVQGAMQPLLKGKSVKSSHLQTCCLY